MVSYYASSSEPAQVRGKTVYIQYSNRQEIVNNKSPEDITGNVLLVTIEGVEPSDVSIDVIYLVSLIFISPFYWLHKLSKLLVNFCFTCFNVFINWSAISMGPWDEEKLYDIALSQVHLLLLVYFGYRQIVHD